MTLYCKFSQNQASSSKLTVSPGYQYEYIFCCDKSNLLGFKAMVRLSLYRFVVLFAMIHND